MNTRVYTPRQRIIERGITMRRVRERLSDLSKLCLCILLAYMIALPGMGTNTLVNTAIADTLGNTTGLDLDLAAFSADRTASPQSLAEAKAALDAANQVKADAAAKQNEAKKAYDSATAEYNSAASDTRKHSRAPMPQRTTLHKNLKQRRLRLRKMLQTQRRILRKSNKRNPQLSVRWKVQMLQ
mgnify:CR=1 FL=1